MGTIKVVFVSSQSDSPVSELSVPEGTTMEQFLALNNVNLDGFNITYKVNGEATDYDLGDALEDGSRVTVTPENIKGN